MPTRKLYQDTCGHCQGAGKTRAVDRKVCAKCKGQGWILSKGTGASICTTCNGDGDVSYMNVCHICEGRGFQVRMVEIQYAEIACEHCRATGLVQEQCRACEGTGYRFEERTALEVLCIYCFGAGNTGKIVSCEICNGQRVRTCEVEVPFNPRETT